jgi:hypothetical protein
MVKHAACAAASNSSGFVPDSELNRVPMEYSASRKAPLSVEILPLPSFKFPSHVISAFLSIVPPMVAYQRQFWLQVWCRLGK